MSNTLCKNKNFIINGYDKNCFMIIRKSFVHINYIIVYADFTHIEPIEPNY